MDECRMTLSAQAWAQHTGSARAPPRAEAFYECHMTLIRKKKYWKTLGGVYECYLTLGMACFYECHMTLCHFMSVV